MGRMSVDTFEWPVAWDMLPERTDDNRAVLQRAVDTATGVLWALTGRQYGLRPVEARPCPTGQCVGVPLLGTSWAPVLDSGRVRNVSTVVADCGRQGGLYLPGPVHELLEWVVDGQARPVAELWLADGVVHHAGDGGWPAQDLGRPATEVGTWAVRYLQGVPVPPGGDGMVARLAREFYAAETGGNCQLPQRAQSVTRQGVTVNMVDPAAIYESGATGLTEVDLWVRAHNPYRQAAPAGVWSPESGVW